MVGEGLLDGDQVGLERLHALREYVVCLVVITSVERVRRLSRGPHETPTHTRVTKTVLTLENSSWNSVVSVVMSMVDYTTDLLVQRVVLVQ